MLTLDVRHLAERMFFAGYAKEKHAERNSEDALAEKASHNALPQLSVSGVARKDESADKTLKDAVLRLLSDAVARTDRNNAWNEVFALVLLFVGT